MAFMTLELGLTVDEAYTLIDTLDRILELAGLDHPASLLSPNEAPVPILNRIAERIRLLLAQTECGV